MTAREELASLLLHQRIRALIKRAGLTQEEFGLELGADRPRVNGWARGRGGISPEYGEKIAAFASELYGETLPASLFTSEPKPSNLHLAEEVAAARAQITELQERLEAVESRLPRP